MLTVAIFVVLIAAFVASVQAAPTLPFADTPKSCLRLDCDLMVQAYPKAKLDEIFQNAWKKAHDSDLASGDRLKKVGVADAIQAAADLPPTMPLLSLGVGVGALIAFENSLLKQNRKSKGDYIWQMTGFEPQPGPYTLLANGIPNLTDTTRYKARVRIYRAVVDVPAGHAYYLKEVGVSGESTAVAWIENCSRDDEVHCS